MVLISLNFYMFSVQARSLALPPNYPSPHVTKVNMLHSVGFHVEMFDLAVVLQQKTDDAL